MVYKLSNSSLWQHQHNTPTRLDKGNDTRKQSRYFHATMSLNTKRTGTSSPSLRPTNTTRGCTNRKTQHCIVLCKAGIHLDQPCIRRGRHITPLSEARHPSRRRREHWKHDSKYQGRESTGTRVIANSEKSGTMKTKPLEIQSLQQAIWPLSTSPHSPRRRQLPSAGCPEQCISNYSLKQLDHLGWCPFNCTPIRWMRRALAIESRSTERLSDVRTPSIIRRDPTTSTCQIHTVRATLVKDSIEWSTSWCGELSGQPNTNHFLIQRGDEALQYWNAEIKASARRPWLMIYSDTIPGSGGTSDQERPNHLLSQCGNEPTRTTCAHIPNGIDQDYTVDWLSCHSRTGNNIRYTFLRDNYRVKCDIKESLEKIQTRFMSRYLLATDVQEIKIEWREFQLPKRVGYLQYHSLIVQHVSRMSSISSNITTVN